MVAAVGVNRNGSVCVSRPRSISSSDSHAMAPGQCRLASLLGWEKDEMTTFQRPCSDGAVTSVPPLFSVYRKRTAEGPVGSEAVGGGGTAPHAVPAHHGRLASLAVITLM